jgi:hypothetical protein
MTRRITVILALGLAGLPACPAVAQEPRAKAKPQRPWLPEGVKIERDLAYGPHKERNTLDLYFPTEGKAPARWSSGSTVVPGGAGARTADRDRRCNSCGAGTRSHAAFQKAGVDSTLMIIPGAGHGPEILTPETLQAVVVFFDEHLQRGAVAH